MSEAIIPIAVGLFSAVFTSVSTVVIGYYRTKNDVNSKLVKIEEQIGDVKEEIKCFDDYRIRVNALELKMEIWWKAMQDSMVDVLHHPNTPERDGLLEKLRDKKITETEKENLKVLLKRMVDEKSAEAPAAALLLVSLNNTDSVKRRPDC